MQVGEGWRLISCFDNFYHQIHFMFDFYKGLNYKRPPFLKLDT